MAATAPQEPGPPTHRAVVVFLFSGQRVAQRLKPGDPNPSAEALEVIAQQWVASSGGVPVVARVLEAMPSLRASGVGGAAGPAGSVPRP